MARMDTWICVSISDRLVSYALCDLSCSSKIYHIMLKINIVTCILYVFVQSSALQFKRLKRPVWFVCCNLCCQVSEKRNFISCSSSAKNILIAVSPVATTHPRQTIRSNEETVNVLDMQSSVQNAKAVDVLIRVKWPSKDAERKLPEDFISLGKMLAHRTYKQITNAAWQDKSLKKELTELVQKHIEKECSHLCSKKDPSCLRKTSKDDMLWFSMEKLTMEIQQRALLFHSVLSAAAVNFKSKAKIHLLKLNLGPLEWQLPHAFATDHSTWLQISYW